MAIVSLLAQQPGLFILTVEAFLLVFPRFTSRKSLPRKVISDNASTFLSVNNELKELFQSHVLKEMLAREGIEWLFIPKKALGTVGFGNASLLLALRSYSAELQSTCALFKQLLLKWQQFLMITPWTVSSDIKDKEALTPAHLLNGQQITSVPHPLVESDEVSDPTYQTNTDFLRKAKGVTLLIQHFW